MMKHLFILLLLAAGSSFLLPAQTFKVLNASPTDSQKIQKEKVADTLFSPKAKSHQVTADANLRPTVTDAKSRQGITPAKSNQRTTDTQTDLVAAKARLQQITSKTKPHQVEAKNSSGWISSSLDKKTLITIFGITGVFGMPVAIVLLIFYFRHKNLKVKCEIAVKALEMGKEVPENLFNPAKENGNILKKGISNIFLGIGLGIFLWATTDNFGTACAGFLIMYIGIGQVIIHRVSRPKDDGKSTISKNTYDHTDATSDEK